MPLKPVLSPNVGRVAPPNVPRRRRILEPSDDESRNYVADAEGLVLSAQGARGRGGCRLCHACKAMLRGALALAHQHLDQKSGERGRCVKQDHAENAEALACRFELAPLHR